MHRHTSVALSAVALIGLGLFAIPSPATARTSDTAVSTSVAQAIASPSRQDFDGDGIDDLAIQSVGLGTYDGHSFSSTGACCVIVDYSSGADTSYLYSTTAAGAGPSFGDELTAGDFDGDGFDDLAVTAPGESQSGADGRFAGGVWVFSGSPTGLPQTASAHITRDWPQIDGDAAANDFFGSALSSGDVNADGFDDIAIGIPGAEVDGAARAGQVAVVYGSGAGLSPESAVNVTQGSTGMPGPTHTDAGFGTVVEIADVTGSGPEDLVLLGGGRKITQAAALVSVKGTYHGLDFSRTTHVHTEGSIDDILSADVNGDGRADIVALAPRYARGTLYQVLGTKRGLDSSATVFTKETKGLPGVDDYQHDFFGYSAAEVPIGGNHFADLAVGNIGQRVGGRPSAGAVTVLRGGPHGLTTRGARLYTQSSTNWKTCGEPKRDRYFGAGLMSLDLDGDGTATTFVSPYDIDGGMLGVDLTTAPSPTTCREPDFYSQGGLDIVVIGPRFPG